MGGTVHIELDETLVRSARALSAGQSESDSQAVASALTAFFGIAAFEEAHTRGSLEPDAADDLALTESAAVRAERSARGA